MKVPGLKVIRRAARLVPLSRREGWRREWEAEVAYAWTRMGREGSPSLVARLSLRLRVLWCWIDALWEMKEEIRMHAFAHDLRLSLRSLGRHPGFAAIAILTLALGIGANTAVFTLVDGVLLRPLPFAEPEELISVRHEGRGGQDQVPLSDGLYLLYGEQASSLEEVALYFSSEMNLVVEGEAERIPVQVATPSFFRTLGVPATLGRAFLQEEELPGGEPVAILSYGKWVSTFGEDPDIVGKTIDLNGVMRRIVGVMPVGFGFPEAGAQLWVPYQVDPAQAPLAAFQARGIARMSPGSSVESVRTELQGLITRLPELFPDAGGATFLLDVNLQAVPEPLKEALVGNVSRTLLVILGTVGFVLLIAAANVANLLLVRAESRQRELSLRLSLGAGRADLVRFFMGESLVLSLVGGGLGVLVSSWALGLSTRFIPDSIPRVAGVGLDLRVLAFTAAITLGCALFFGLFPMVRFLGEDLAGGLKEGGGRGETAGRGRNRLRNGLVVLQVAMALVLLVGAGLMLRTFQALRAVDPGFHTERVLTARLSVPPGEMEGWEETVAFYRQYQEAIAAQPGVELVTLAQTAPLTSFLGFIVIGVEDHPRGPGDPPIATSITQVDQGFFRTMGIPLLEGRSFDAGDGAQGARSVVVSESFARKWWPEGSPLGRRLGAPGPDGNSWWEIVGVVADVQHQTLGTVTEDIVYYPMTVGNPEAPRVARSMDILVRTSGDPVGLVPVLRRELSALNSRIPLSNPRSMNDVLRAATARTSFTMSMLAVASGIALILGLVGIYGVISYVVSQRTREIGVRMALGATAPSVRGMVVRQGLTLAVVGVVVGLAAAGALSSLMSSLLYGVASFDALTYGSVAVAMLGVSVLGSWIPARRAAGVDPSRALRED